MAFIERLDYAVTIDGNNPVKYFRVFPERGTVGYPTYEDALVDTSGIENIDVHLDAVEAFINARLIGDLYYLSNGQVVKVVSDTEKWDWTPEKGLVPWD